MCNHCGVVRSRDGRYVASAVRQLCHTISSYLAIYHPAIREKSVVDQSGSLFEYKYDGIDSSLAGEDLKLSLRHYRVIQSPFTVTGRME